MPDSKRWSHDEAEKVWSEKLKVEEYEVDEQVRLIFP